MLLSLKRKNRLWIIETSRFLNEPQAFLWNISILLRPFDFHIGLNENANSFFATRCRF